jgi:hypothetical protein
MYDGFGKLPGFTAVKQDGLYVGVENPYFGASRNMHSMIDIKFGNIFQVSKLCEVKSPMFSIPHTKGGGR